MDPKEIPITKPSFDEAEERSVLESLRSGWVTQGPKVVGFEASVAAYVGVRYAVATTSWSTAMFLAMRLSGIGEGDEVIVPSFTCPATPNAIRQTGAMPVFVDIDRRTFNIDPALIEPAITPRTKAIMPVHYLGLPADMEPVFEVARRHGLLVFEDGAVALGGGFRGKKVGNLGAPTGFSFHGRKIITTGEGGMLTTNDQALADKMRIVRSHGVSVSDLARHQAKGALIQEYTEMGFNFRMTDLQGAVGVEQMKKLPYFVQRRQELARRYDALLAEMPEVETPYVPAGMEHSYSTYLIWLTSRCRHSLEDLLKACSQRGISCRHSIISHTQPYFRTLAPDLVLPITEEAARRTVALPLYPTMTDGDQDAVVSCLKKVFATS